MPQLHEPPTPDAAAATPTPSVRRSRGLTLALLLGLIALGLGWELWWAPTGRGTLAIKVVPLGLAVAGVWRYRLYTYRWLSLLTWAYVAEGAMRAPGEPTLSGQASAWAEVVLASGLFAACAWHVRARFAAGRALACPARGVEAPPPGINATPSSKPTAS